jgi:hypothetical protein
MALHPQHEETAPSMFMVTISVGLTACASPITERKDSTPLIPEPATGHDLISYGLMTGLIGYFFLNQFLDIVVHK